MTLPRILLYLVVFLLVLTIFRCVIATSSGNDFVLSVPYVINSLRNSISDNQFYQDLFIDFQIARCKIRSIIHSFDQHTDFIRYKFYTYDERIAYYVAGGNSLIEARKQVFLEMKGLQALGKSDAIIYGIGTPRYENFVYHGVHYTERVPYGILSAQGILENPAYEEGFTFKNVATFFKNLGQYANLIWTFVTTFFWIAVHSLRDSVLLMGALFDFFFKLLFAPISAFY